MTSPQEKRQSQRRRGPVPAHPFDTLHGTDTGALIPGEDLATGHRHDRHITAYHGTPPSLFRKLMARWKSLAIHPVERTVFVDIGAGKGRAMLLAAEMPFRRIVGVELHPHLAAAARSNLEVWGQDRIGKKSPALESRTGQRGKLKGVARPGTAPSWGDRTLALSPHGTPLRFMEADALQLRLPAGPCCVFLFNPFGPVLMDRFLMRLTKQFAGRGQDLDVLYVNNEQRDLIASEHPRFQELWHGRIFLSREDREADKATIQHCADGLYVTTGYEDCSIYRVTAGSK